MNCQDAVDRMYEYLDEELTPEVREDVRRHLAACLPCLQHFGFEEAYLRFLRARTAAKSAPAGLRRQILEKIIDEEKKRCD